MSQTKHLALAGGQPAVTIPQPHFVWPYPSTKAEKVALATQRDLDISIKGRTGPIAELEDEFLATTLGRGITSCSTSIHYYPADRNCASTLYSEISR